MRVFDKSHRLIEWGVAARHHGVEAESGDCCVVQQSTRGALVAVIDGVGHGAEAARVARTAAAVLEKYADESVIELVQRCHRQLLSMRGAVMTLASFDAVDGTMMWLGVGNVEGVLLRTDPTATPNIESPVLRGGVVGYQLPPLRASVIPVRRGDTLILATDGIRSGFAERSVLHDSPQKTADAILARHGKETDDALVLVARYLGRAS
ncbi:MAG: SpoIIE family protein phosphatase [Nitrospirae bacterium]|nr:SpoIIE family protein phosphatase [Nitrospirota bacterium]